MLIGTRRRMSFITWVIYAAYLHARSTAGWRDKKAAWINVVGFVAMVFPALFLHQPGDFVGSASTPASN